MRLSAAPWTWTSGAAGCRTPGSDARPFEQAPRDFLRCGFQPRRWMGDEGRRWTFSAGFPSPCNPRAGRPRPRIHPLPSRRTVGAGRLERGVPSCPGCLFFLPRPIRQGAAESRTSLVGSMSSATVLPKPLCWIHLPNSATARIKEGECLCTPHALDTDPIAPTPIAAIHQRSENIFQSLENGRRADGAPDCAGVGWGMRYVVL